MLAQREGSMHICRGRSGKAGGRREPTRPARTPPSYRAEPEPVETAHGAVAQLEDSPHRRAGAGGAVCDNTNYQHQKRRFVRTPSTSALGIAEVPLGSDGLGTLPPGLTMY